MSHRKQNDALKTIRELISNNINSLKSILFKQNIDDDVDIRL